jgi:hypothetical protein
VLRFSACLNRRETDGRIVERPRTSITDRKSTSPPQLFGRRGGVTLARFSYFSGTCKYPSTHTYAQIKQKYQNGNIHRKLRVAMSTILCFPEVQYCTLGKEEIMDVGTLSFR